MTTIYLILTAAVGVVAAFFGGQYAGKREGRSEAVSDALKRDAAAAKDAKDRKEELKNESDTDLVDRLTSGD